MVSFHSLKLFKIPDLNSLSRKYHIWVPSGTASIHCFDFFVLFLCFSCVWSIVSHTFACLIIFFVENYGHLENCNVATWKIDYMPLPKFVLLVYFLSIFSELILYSYSSVPLKSLAYYLSGQLMTEHRFP